MHKCHRRMIFSLFLLLLCGLLSFAGRASPDREVAQLHVGQRTSKLQITVRNASLVSELAGIEKDVRRIVYGPGGTEVAFVGWERPVEILDSEDYHLLRTIGDGRKIIHFAFSPDKDTVAFCENGWDAAMLNVRTGNLRYRPAGNHQPKMEFSPDGRFLATGGYGDYARLFPIYTFKLPPSRTATVSPRGDWFKSLGGWEIEGGLTTAFSPDSKILAVGNRNSTTKLFDVATGEMLHELSESSSHELRFSPDGQVLAVAYVDGRVALWSVHDGAQLRIADTGAQETYTVDWSPDGQILATAGRESNIILWNAEDLSVLARLPAPEWVIRVKFSPDGTRLLSAGGAAGLGKGPRTVLVWGVP